MLTSGLYTSSIVLNQNAWESLVDLLVASLRGLDFAFWTDLWAIPFLLLKSQQTLEVEVIHVGRIIDIPSPRHIQRV